MGKFDCTIETCRKKIKELHQEMTVVYEKEACNLGECLKITPEDCKERVAQIWKGIDELQFVIKILKMLKKGG